LCRALRNPPPFFIHDVRDVVNVQTVGNPFRPQATSRFEPTRGIVQVLFDPRV
jgi:hypothetical protein